MAMVLIQVATWKFLFYGKSTGFVFSSLLWATFLSLSIQRCNQIQQARIQGRWNGWIFTLLFLSPLLSFFSYPSNIDLKHFNQALVLLHYYKNSPPISKSWIRACTVYKTPYTNLTWQGNTAVLLIVFWRKNPRDLTKHSKTVAFALKFWKERYHIRRCWLTSSLTPI